MIRDRFPWIAWGFDVALCLLCGLIAFLEYQAQYRSIPEWTGWVMNTTSPSWYGWMIACGAWFYTSSLEFPWKRSK